MFLKHFLIALPIVFVIDIAWIGVIAKHFYRSQIGYMLRPDIRWGAAIVFYLLFAAGLTFFVIEPAAEKKLWIEALRNGAFFGLIAYGAYDLTNLATAKGWPVAVTLADLAYGAVLSASVATLAYAIGQRIG